MYNFLLNYRATPHTTTGVPPAELLFHRKIRIKLPHYSPTLDTHAMEHSARKNDLKQKIKNKNYTDTQTHATKSVIKVGNHVLVQQDKTNKFSTHFVPRPYLVTARQGCLLVLERNGKHLKQNVAHCKIIPNYNRREMIESDTDGEDIDDINYRVIQNRNTPPPGTCVRHYPRCNKQPPKYFHHQISKSNERFYQS